ncbi:MAG: methylated-DNA--[protein]-cysteine S-methyltransferase [Paenisporosarcina sp.]
MIKILQSPLGELAITVSEGKLVSIEFEHKKQSGELNLNRRDNKVMTEAVKQIDEYFNSERTTFSLPLSKQGTVFQQSVWEQLHGIPFGETISYQELAIRIGKPGASRAVGQANRRNPLPIVVPCHRVIGKDRSLKGYAGSLTSLKELLLLHEAKQSKEVF